jgi:methylated-DNA-[protein]-cysteine S-methyltransferase
MPYLKFEHLGQNYTVSGTDLQIMVWSELRQIPKGKTLTYTELAKRIGRPKAIRAVANACGKNPLPIIIPCHRIICSNGTLGGYSGPGGIQKKRELLAQELQSIYSML